MLIRLGPPLAVFLLTGPILLGLAGTLLPALGFLPALGGMALTLDHLADVATRPGMAASTAMSLAAGLVTAAVSLGAVFLFVGAFAGTRIFERVQHLISPLLSVPHAAAAFGLAFLIAPSGMVARLVSPELTGWMRPPDMLIVNDPMGLSMMAGLIVKEIPFLLLVTLAALPQLRLAETRALTASLGYGRLAGFLFALWPGIYRQIRLAVFAVIAFATSVVDVAAILGPTTPAPLAVRLVQWMSDPDLGARYVASAGAVLQLGVTAAALAVWIAGERLLGGLVMALCETGRRLRRDRLPAIAGLAAMLATFAVIAAGLVTLALWSFAGLWQFPDALPKSFSFRTWMQAGPRIAGPLATTLVVAVLSTLIAAALAILCLMREDETGRRNNRSLWLIYLPLLVPQAAFLFGLQLLFLVAGADATLAALVFTHLIFVLPYVFLSLRDPWRAFDRRFDAVAAGLGKGRWAALFHVRLPMLARAVLTAAAVGFAVSIGQYLPTVLIGAGRLDTITTEAVALASGGNRRVIGVYAFLQMALPAAGFLVATAVPALLFRSRRALRV
ncbi:MAG: ABC transporter permease subunit [Rhizobiaceae bacterium]